MQGGWAGLVEDGRGGWGRGGGREPAAPPPASKTGGAELMGRVVGDETVPGGKTKKNTLDSTAGVHTGRKAKCREASFYKL